MKKFTYEKDTVSELMLLPNLYGFMEDCDVYFENAGLHAVIETYGRVAFADEAGNIVAETKIEAKTEDDKHTGGFCGIRDGKICVFLQIVRLKDTYPNCDGEHDRWVTTIVGYNCIAFDPATGIIAESQVEKVE